MTSSGRTTRTGMTRGFTRPGNLSFWVRCQRQTPSRSLETCHTGYSANVLLFLVPPRFRCPSLPSSLYLFPLFLSLSPPLFWLLYTPPPSLLSYAILFTIVIKNLTPSPLASSSFTSCSPFTASSFTDKMSESITYVQMKNR